MTRFAFVAFSLLLSPLLPAQDYDLVIRRARLIDGTGSPAVAGDVAIRDGRIAAVGAVPGKGRTEIDAAGQVVAPGFIDVHTHSENITDIPAAENFLRMGVTTIITGNCGGSKLDVAEFFGDITKTRVALNVATLIGQGRVRAQVMGGSFMRPPTPMELEKMREIVAQAMKDGAVGMSTGLIYLPGAFTKTEEIIELAKVVAAYGGIYASHMRDEQSEILDSIAEVIRISREAKIAAQISHLKLLSPVSWGRNEEVIARLNQARAEGLTVTHDQYVYTASSTSISSRIPEWIREGGRNRFRERLADPVQKARCVADMKQTLQKNREPDYSYAVIANFQPAPRLNGKTIPQAAKILRGSDTLEDQIETMLDLEARGGAQGVFHGMSEADLVKFLAHPLTMIASDAGVRRFGEAVPHPRGYGNNARVLGRYVREQKVITLEDAVRKMTSLPARSFHLKNRGELKPGFVADVVIFDPEKVTDPSTFEDPHRYAVGFSDVLVNGVPVIRAGQLTEARPGRPVKLHE